MILFLIFILFFPHLNNNSIQYTLNNGQRCSNHTIFITINDELTLYNPNEVYWVFYKPLLKEYNNLINGADKLTEIVYRSEPISLQKTHEIKLKKMKSGTYNLSILPQKKTSEIISSKPIHLNTVNIVQIVVREDNTYIGYLTELIGLPFILPPKTIGKFGHQTDLRMGTDCAELAIYGIRRMGYNIPYCGPKGILKYLKPTNKLIKGTIIHFGYQVSVLYEDKGQKGILDGQDLIIHAYKDKVTIEQLENTELINKEFKLFQWTNIKL